MASKRMKSCGLPGAILVILAVAGCGETAITAPTDTAQAQEAQSAPAGGAAQAVAGPTRAEAVVLTLPAGAVVVEVTPQAKKGQATAVPGLDDTLAQLVAAFRAGDSERLAALAGNRHIDLAAGTVRVILEMARDPEAHQAGTPIVEEVKGADGQVTQIVHLAPIAIREELAQAIAATGATYETATESLVQVLAPFGSLEALARIADVSRVRLPSAGGY